MELADLAEETGLSFCCLFLPLLENRLPLDIAYCRLWWGWDEPRAPKFKLLEDEGLL